MVRDVEGAAEKLTLLYIGLGLTIAGIAVMFVFGPGLSFTLGLLSISLGLIFFGVGLRSRIVNKNSALGNIVVVATSVSNVILIAWYLLL
ncbi:MAG: hypothetical protein P8Z41_11520 [Anaerolineales bacterium]|jgi:hypothetical protein